MRVGTSPNKTLTTDYRPARVTVCVLVSVPNREGYYAHRFDVVKLCLASVIRNTPAASHDLLVFDNGSCPQVVDWLAGLREQGHIHYLLSSARNVGKVNAYRMMFSAAPGEVVAYADDDVLFYPGWLDAHLSVLDTFPRVGMVSGVPVRHQFRYGNAYLASYLEDYPAISVTRGRLIPDAWNTEFCESTGRIEVSGGGTPEADDVLLSYQGATAYSTAAHFQFVAFKRVMLEALPDVFDPRLMREPVREVDERIDARGYARLSTNARVVRHLGNVISSDLRDDLAGLGLSDIARLWTPPGRVSRWAARTVGLAGRITNWHYFARRYRDPGTVR